MRDEPICFTIGETVLAGRLWRPDRAASEVVLCLHGVESHAAWFETLAPALTTRELAVVAFDRPGWGRSAEPRGHLASYAEVVRQVSEIASRLRRDYQVLHLAGLSWGGLLALYVALRRAPLFDSVTLIAPGLYPTHDLSWTAKLQAAGGLLTGQPTAIPLPIDPAHFTSRPARAEWIRVDPLRNSAVTPAFCLETLKMRRFVDEMLGRRPLPPTQCLLAGDDQIIDNAATRRRLEGMGLAIKEYPGLMHSLIFEDPEGVAGDIARLAASRRHEAGRTEAGARVLVLGAGAVGSAVGGLLALAGREVTLLARPAHATAVTQTGLLLKVGEGERRVRRNLTAVADPEAALARGPYDLVILAVKSYATPAALADLARLADRDTVILCLQNGLTGEERLVEAFPRHTILAGAICAYLDFVGPGVVWWRDDRGGLTAAIQAGDGGLGVSVWRKVFPPLGMAAEFLTAPDAARSVKWSKLMLNLAFNALNGLTGLSAGEILAHPRHGSLAVTALREGFAVMQREGIRPVDLPGYPVRRMAQACRLPLPLARRLLAWGASGSGARSSLAQDLARGGATEIETLNGAVVAAGERLGLPTPANSELCALVRARG